MAKRKQLKHDPSEWQIFKNAEILREFVEKVYVYQTAYILGEKVQKIKIVWNCTGDFDFSTSGAK